MATRVQFTDRRVLDLHPRMKRVAHWARTTLEIGGGTFVPCALSLSGMAEITDPEHAREHSEMAVLAAVGHGRDRRMNPGGRETG